MTIQTGSGVTLAIGTTTAADDQAEFEGDSYTTVGEVSELGEFGDERSAVTFATLANARMQKARGVADAGDMSVTYAYKGDDTGQDALKTAFETTSQTADEFNFRVQFNDAVGSGEPTTFYFRAKVMARRVQSISNDSVVTVVATLAINSAVIEVEAA